MSCGVCGHYWCWVCGLPVDNCFHAITFKGMMCEVFNGLLFGFEANIHVCLRILLLILIICFGPLLLLLICIYGGIYAACKCCCCFNRNNSNSLKVKFVMIVLTIIQGLISLVLGTGLGVVMFALVMTAICIIVPFYILFVLVQWCLRSKRGSM